MSTERDDIDLELKKIQLARERLALEDELKARERKQKTAGALAGVAQKAGDATKVAAFSAGFVGARLVEEAKTIVMRMLYVAAIVGVLLVLVTIGLYVVNALKGP